MKLKIVLALVITFIILNLCVINNKGNAEERFNVVWFLVDALRADHLGCYGYEKNTSPFIDKFSRKSILFKNAFSQESYTQASTPSYFTSTYPPVHKVFYDSPTIDILDSEFVTLAEILDDAGYNTAAFVFNPHLKAGFNFGQGFDLYDDNEKGFDTSLPWHEAYETARKIHEKTERYLKKTATKPVFLYLHYRDVHNPYAPPPPYHKLFLPPGVLPAVDIIYTKKIPFDKKSMDLIISQYDGEIRYTDFYIEKTLKMLKDYGINPKNSIIIITADHGEEFIDYHPEDPGGIKHGRTLYKEQIHVPLIISIPGIRGRKKINSPVELVDIAPTILEVLNIDWKKYNQFQGKSLLPIIKRDGSFASLRTSFYSRVIYSGGNHKRHAIIEGDYKYYIYDTHTKANRQACFARPKDEYNYVFGEELYNIKKDPYETRNLIDEEKDVAARLKKKLAALKKGFPAEKGASSIEPDEETKKQLKSLGYLQ